MKKKLQLAGATLAIAAAGGGAALAATHGGKSATAGTTNRTAATGMLGRPPAGGHFDADLAAAAAYLGTTKAKLQVQLRAGKTLATIASSTSGKSTAGLIDAIVAAETKQLGLRNLSTAQRTRMLAGLKQRVTSFVNGTRPAGAPPGGVGGKPPTA